jgi:hypothetical protein
MPSSRGRDSSQDRALDVVEGQVIKRGAEHENYPREPRKRGCNPLALLFRGAGCGPGLLMGGVPLLVIVVLVACVAMLLTLQISDFLHSPLDSVLEIFGFEKNSKPTVADSRTIVRGIQKMAVLQTVSGDIEVIKTVVDTGPAPDAELKVSYIGHVTAGIDLSLVTEQSIVFQPDGSLMITLPPAQLTGCYLGKGDVLSRSCVDIPLWQDCGSIIDRLQNEAYNRSLDELRDTANEMDLVSLAYTEAESRIYDLLKNLGHQQVSFQRSAESLPPSSTCYPN